MASSSENEHEAPIEGDKFRCLRHGQCVYHDIFISYRVNTEKKLADKYALLLDGYTRGDGGKVRTFLDSHCLLDGGNWEKNFLSALHHSKLILLLISEDGLDLPSASAPGLTKIQNADQEQDNCLLEYEYALRLSERQKATVFVLCVEKEVNLGGIRCKVKFPTDPDSIARRLKMYANTKEHDHRDGSKGPLVSETMGKLLLGLLEPSNLGATFAHVDPDDAPSRLPNILWKLKETEGKYTFQKKATMFFKDLSYFKTKTIGVLCGMFLPFISLLFTLTARSARHQALRLGIFIGHGVDFLALAVYCFYETFSALPSNCGDFKLCTKKVVEIGKTHPDLLTPCLNSTDFQYRYTCSLKDLTVPTNNCVTCVCNDWLFYCSGQASNKKAFLFIAVLFLVLAFALFAYARYVVVRSGIKKSRVR